MFYRTVYPMTAKSGLRFCWIAWWSGESELAFNENGRWITFKHVSYAEVQHVLNHW